MYEFYQLFERLHIEDIISDKLAEFPEELLAQHVPEISYQIIVGLPTDWRRILLLSFKENMSIEANDHYANGFI